MGGFAISHNPGVIVAVALLASTIFAAESPAGPAPTITTSYSIDSRIVSVMARILPACGYPDHITARQFPACAEVYPGRLISVNEYATFWLRLASLGGVPDGFGERDNE